MGPAEISCGGRPALSRQCAGIADAAQHGGADRARDQGRMGRGHVAARLFAATGCHDGRKMGQGGLSGRISVAHNLFAKRLSPWRIMRVYFRIRSSQKEDVANSANFGFGTRVHSGPSQMRARAVTPPAECTQPFVGFSWKPHSRIASESALFLPARSRQTLRFSAEVLPRLATSSYSTVCPSLSEERPAFSTAEI